MLRWDEEMRASKSCYSMLLLNLVDSVMLFKKIYYTILGTIDAASCVMLCYVSREIIAVCLLVGYVTYIAALKSL